MSYISLAPGNRLVPRDPQVTAAENFRALLRAKPEARTLPSDSRSVTVKGSLTDVRA
ncbi:hypothetical protein [Desulfohalovibrio reitneri]|uniref:hypothetical protein n=1 Tax=Desulfohalovibrio reitneri TaxID=1307759 RepID=UPI00137833CB|nr:hypothetical protein [Desulfohalovibrio reitneri]